MTSDCVCSQGGNLLTQNCITFFPIYGSHQLLLSFKLPLSLERVGNSLPAGSNYVHGWHIPSRLTDVIALHVLSFSQRANELGSNKLTKLLKEPLT